MTCGFHLHFPVRAVRILFFSLLAFSLVAAADAAERRGLFGRLRKDPDDDAPKRTYYQPSELQWERPAVVAAPAPDPKSVLSPAGNAAGDRKSATPSAVQGDKSAERPAVGDPLAPGKTVLLLQDMVAAIRSRRLDSEFARWRGYMAGRMDSSASRATGTELAGNCRLKWYDRLMHSPIAAPAAAEQFTRELHQAVLGGAAGFADVLRIAREKLDAPKREIPALAKIDSSAKALEVLQEVLASVRTDYAAVLSPLDESEVNELTSNSYQVFVGGNYVGHTVNDRTYARRLCDLMEKMNRGAMLAAAEDLLPVISEDFRKQLDAIPEQGSVSAPGVSGRVLKKISTASGTILIGGRGKNVYRLDDMPDVAAVIDLGGDDEYLEGSVSHQRPVLVIIDLKGNDAYRGTRPGIQGGAILGVSLLLDWEGNDSYNAQDVAQASAIAGIGILIDNAGSDVYNGHRRVQAHALAGLGVLVDRGGDDRYRCAFWGQGMGGPLGFGLLDDISGDDHYFAGGVYPDSYKETPGLEGWGQGVGGGIRQVANGGIGVLLEGDGDDVYEFDYLSHGGGYWCGLGFLRDFGGDDKHLASTELSYSGGPRTQPEYQRFGNGWGCHYAMGFLFDDAGDDVYRGTIMGIGFGWDCSLGMLADFGGNDRYEGDSSSLQGSGSQCSTGILFDYSGNDVYGGSTQAYAPPSMSYHPLPAGGGNFSFLLDYGGKDEYGCGAGNSAITQSGWAGGYIVDRPRADEVAEAEKDDPKPAPSADNTAARP